MNLIIFDFEVFRYNTLLGYGIVNTEKGTCDYKQTWDLDEMRLLYVAMTRARENLILVAAVKDAKKQFLKNHWLF